MEAEFPVHTVHRLIEAFEVRTSEFRVYTLAISGIHSPPAEKSFRGQVFGFEV